MRRRGLGMGMASKRASGPLRTGIAVSPGGGYPAEEASGPGVSTQGI